MGELSTLISSESFWIEFLIGFWGAVALGLWFIIDVTRASTQLQKNSKKKQ